MRNAILSADIAGIVKRCGRVSVCNQEDVFLMEKLRSCFEHCADFLARLIVWY